MLEKVSGCGIALSAKKCSFGVDEVTSFGAAIMDIMKSTGKERVEQIRSLPQPESAAELRRILGHSHTFKNGSQG